MTGVLPSIRVRDMAEALRFYCGPLEFALERGGEAEGNSAVTRGDARIMLETLEEYYGDVYNTELRARLGTPSAISLYVEAPDLVDFYARLQETNVRNRRSVGGAAVGAGGVHGRGPRGQLAGLLGRAGREMRTSHRRTAGRGL